MSATTMIQFGAWLILIITKCILAAAEKEGLSHQNDRAMMAKNK